MSFEPPLYSPKAGEPGTLYWNANMQPMKWTDNCPEYLLGISEKNKGILASREEDYQIIPWQLAQHFVRK